MNLLKCSCAKSWGDAAPFVLRFVTGLLFLLHGWMKFGDMNSTVGMLSSLRVPAPELLAWVITVLEVVGGIALIFGAMTHWVAKFLAFEMLIAFILMSCVKGIFDQSALLLFAAAFSLMVTGAGKWSLDEWMLKTCCGKCVNGVCSEHGGNAGMMK